MQRYAEIRGASGVHDLDTVNAYMPSNYRAMLRADMSSIVIVGEDVAGWTLDGYVIPRLASGLIFATEISAGDVSQVPRVDCDHCADRWGGCVYCSEGATFDPYACDARDA